MHSCYGICIFMFPILVVRSSLFSVDDPSQRVFIRSDILHDGIYEVSLTEADINNMVKWSPDNKIAPGLLPHQAKELADKLLLTWPKIENVDYVIKSINYIEIRKHYWICNVPVVMQRRGFSSGQPYIKNIYIMMNGHVLPITKRERE